MTPRSLRAALLEQACGFRCGLVQPVAVSEGTLADLPDHFNAVVEGDAALDGESLSGGLARSPQDARAAAIGEALERYCATAAVLPLARVRDLGHRAVLPSRAFGLFTAAQHAQPGFPWPEPDEAAEVLAPVFSLRDNAEVWVPQELVGLGSRVDPPRLPSTSTGLAAFTDPLGAILRGLEEVLERDALAATWLNALPGRELAIPDPERAAVVARSGEVRAFDLTQAWNPHPVVAVAGHLPLRGFRRLSFGAACRATLPLALEAAWREWVQGVLFVGYHLAEHPDLRFDRPTDVRDFQQHGAYYAVRPEAWRELPLLRADGRPPRLVPETPAAPPAAPAEALVALLGALEAAGIRVLYRDLTLPDVRRLGVRVVRVMSPDLTLLHADERAPFLGGRARDVGWRYPDLDPLLDTFPSPYPHPLG